MSPLIRETGRVAGQGAVALPEGVAALEWERRYIERVRQVVAKEEFRAVPLSLMVHDFLVLLHRHGHLKGPRCTAAGAGWALARALAHPHGWIGWRRPAPREWARLRGRVLIAGLHPQDRSRRWWQPLAEALGPEETVTWQRAMELRNAQVSDPRFVQAEWIRFCEAARHDALSTILGHGRWLSWLNRAGWIERFWVGEKRLRGIRNMVLCETHRELLQTVFDRWWFPPGGSP